MKKKAILAVGLCLAVGLTGMGLSACGGKGGNPGGDGEKSKYYLAGQSLGTLFGGTWDETTETGGDWYSGYLTAAEIPDAIAFKTTATANTYKLTVDLYKGDNFGVLTAGEGWNGQMGGKTGDERCELDPYTADKTAQLYGAPGGGNTENIMVGVAGNYTLTLAVDPANANNNKITYVRNGDPTVEIHVDYNYWIKGDKVTQGTDLRVAYNQFTANDAKDTYELVIGMQENDQFTFLDQMIEDESSKKEQKSDAITLATDAGTTAAIEKADAEDAENPTGKFKIKDGTGTYKFTLTEDAENNLTLKAEKTAETVPQYDFYLKDNREGDTRMQKRQVKLEFDDGIGLYKTTLQMNKSTANPAADPADPTTAYLPGVASAFELSAVPTPQTPYADEAAIRAAEKFAITTAYKDDYVSNQISTQGGSWLFTETTTDTVTITVDPVSMMVRAQGENDAVFYAAYLKGDIGGTGGGSPVVSTPALSEVNGKWTGAFSYTFEEDDLNKGFGIVTYNYYDANKAQISFVKEEGYNCADGYDFDVCAQVVTDSGSGNMTITEAGTYEFAFVIDEDGKCENLTVRKGEALGVGVKGPATPGGWDTLTPLDGGAAYAEDGTYTIMAAVELGEGDFGFNSYKFYGPEGNQISGGWGGKGADGNSTIKDDYQLNIHSSAADKIDQSGSNLAIKAGQGGTYYVMCVLDEAGQFKSLAITAVWPLPDED